MVEHEKPNVVLTALSAIGGTLFGLSIAAAVIALFATFFLNYHLISVKTGSMEPAIEKGDFVVVRPVRIDKIKEQDVILFNEKNTGVPFVHRVIAIREQRLNIVDGDGKLIDQNREFFFTTKGDANTNNDGGEVSINEYTGRVWFHIPTFGIVAAGLSPTWFLIGLVFFFGILWAAWEVFNRRGGGSGARRSKGKARKSGRPLPTPAGRMEARRRPSMARRLPSLLADRLIDAADAALYAVQVGWYRFRSRASGNSRPRVRRPSRGTVRAGSGLWVLLPAAVWLAAIGIMLGASALAAPGTPGRWEKEQEIGGEVKVKVITPTPTRTPYGYVAPTASPSPSPSPGQQQQPPPSGSSCSEPAFTFTDLLNRRSDGRATPSSTCQPTPPPAQASTPVPSPSAEPSATAELTPTEEPTQVPTPDATGTPPPDPTVEPGGDDDE